MFDLHRMEINFHVSEDRPFFGKYWPDGVPHQITLDPSMTLMGMLKSTATKIPDEPVLWFLDGTMNYQTFFDHVQNFAGHLYKIGIRKGDVVALHLPNCPQYMIAYYAVVSLGAIVTGVNPQYKPMEILHQLKITNAQYIIALDALFEAFIKPIIDEWDFKKIIYTNLLDMAGAIPKWKRWIAKILKKVPSANITLPNSLSFQDCLKSVDKAPEISINPVTDAAVYMMTGGTTGVPKAAVLTHFNCVSNILQSKQTLFNQKIPGRDHALGQGTGMIGVLPLFHSFAMTSVMNFAIGAGGWAILFPKPPPTLELLETFENLPDINGFIYCAAEILFQRIAELPQETLNQFDLKGKLTLCISGAGPLHEYVRIPYEQKTGSIIREGYGLAETSPIVSTNNFFGESNPGTIGTPFPGTDWAIFPIDKFDEGPILEIGEEHTGEICICGPQVMKEYLNESEQTADTLRTWDGRLWIRTGDIGFMDEHGRITIRDRKKQLIKMAGHSVFPKEVESLIGQHPKVLEVAVAGLPDKKTGEAVKAWVALKPEARGTLSKEELMAWIKENLTYWKVPKYLDLIDEVPKSAIGKVMRRQLQEADPLFEKNEE